MLAAGEQVFESIVCLSGPRDKAQRRLKDRDGVRGILERSLGKSVED
jgi:hypothetical protein